MPVPRSRWATAAIFVAGLVTALVLTAVGLAAFHAYRVFNPRTTTPQSADVVVVLAGGRGERLQTALTLIEHEVAPVLVANVGNRDWGQGWEELEPLCRQPEGERVDRGGHEVICVSVSPDNTGGEAKTISALAAEQGWESMVLVTSEDHLHRATLRFDRCFDGTILPVAAPISPEGSDHSDEWLATLHAIVIDRDCNDPAG
jgi:uncharacterized SAM-binding protein YcdF (DUF218 family)